MAEERPPAAEEDFSKLLTAELLDHRSWKARVKGYEDVCLQMQQSTSDRDPLFGKYVAGIKGWASDGNAVALEKALDAVYAFVENAAVASRTAQDVCPVLIQKCIANAKAKIQKKAQEILLLYIEIEKPDVVTDALIEGFSNKNPKVVAQCVASFTTAVSSFGVKPLNVKTAMKQFSGLLEHRDKDVREQAKILAVELCRWIGDVALKPQLQGIKPVQLSELEAEFEKEKGQALKRTPHRYLRSQKPQEAVAPAELSTTEAEAAVQPNNSSAPSAYVEGIDPWTFLEPTDILQKLPKEFFEQIDSAKWLERKECLEGLLKLCTENPRLDPSSNYGELISVIKKIVAKDSNINVVGVALKCVAALAAGLRKKFSCFNSMLVSIILEKFKEKKAVVANACAEAIDAIYKTTTLEALAEDLMGALDNKTPSVKIQVALFLSRAFAGTHPSLLSKKLIKGFCAALLKGIATSDAEVRESSASALGSLLKVAGEKDVLPFLAEIKDDHLKMDKIKEFCAKTVIDPSVMAPSAAPSGESKCPGIASKRVEPAKKATVTKSNVSSTPDKQPDGDKGPTSASAPGGTKGTAKKPGEKAKKDEDPVASTENLVFIDTNQKHQRFQDEKALKLLKWNFTLPTDEHVAQLQNQLSNVCKSCLHVLLFHANFKQHLKAFEMLAQCLQSEPKACVNSSDLLLKWCTLRFFETNPSVLLKTLEFVKNLLQLLIDHNVEMHDMEIASFLPYAILKLGEPKDAVRQEVRQILHKLAKLHPPNKMVPFLLEGCEKTKNSRQKTECIEHMGAFIELLGVGVCGTPPTQSLRQLAQYIGDKDTAVRNAALNALVAAYNRIGDKLYKMIEKIHEKDFDMLQQRIKHAGKLKPGEVPNQATSVISAASQLSEKRPKTAQATLGRESPVLHKVQPESSGGYNENTERNWALDDSPQKPGEFKLELSKIFTKRELMAIGTRPKLPEMSLQPEVARILQEPFEMPKIQRRSPSNRRPTTAGPSPYGRCSSEGVLSVLDTTISQVMSSSILTASQSLMQLDEILKDEAKSMFLVGKIDQLLMAVYFQLRMACNSHMTDPSLDQNDVLRLYRHLCVVLFSLCSTGTLIQEASDCTLKDLTCQLLTVLVDDRLKVSKDHSELIRSVNLLVLNLVTKSDHTCCFVALIRLLCDTLHSQTSSAKFEELVMKCLWKLTSQLPHTADKLQVDRVLVECHKFFVDFPSAMWKQRQMTSTPLRTIKTILNSLCRILGDKILDNVGLIDKADTSEAIFYVKKCLGEIAQKCQGAVNKTSSKDTSGVSNGCGVSSSSAIDALKTLQRLREKGGLDPSTVVTPTLSSSAIAVTLPEVVQFSQKSNEENRGAGEYVDNNDLTELKNRLEKIKRESQLK